MGNSFNWDSGANRVIRLDVQSIDSKVGKDNPTGAKKVFSRLPAIEIDIYEYKEIEG